MGALARAAKIALAAVTLSLASPPVSYAASPEGEGEHTVSVPDAIFHHVTDGRDISFENPITGATLHFDLPQWVVDVGGTRIDLSPTRHLIYMWIAAALLIVVLTLAARRRSLVPSGFYSVVEVLVRFVREELAVKNIGKEHADDYVGYLCTAFFFIFTMNLLGLVPYSATATGNLAVTAGLALLTFGMMLFAGMRSQGAIGYWLHIVPSGVPKWLYVIMVPVELLSLLTKPFALAIRLFANMTAGHIVLFFLLGLIFLIPAAGAFIAPVSVAFAAAIFLLEIFVALLQAYIFTMLSALFIGMASHPH